MMIACSLGPGDFRDRLTWIADLTRDALRGYDRQDLTMHLRYAPAAADRVREMVRREQTCCHFLTFDVYDAPDEIRVAITAPEEARTVAELLFEEFVAGWRTGAYTR